MADPLAAAIDRDAECTPGVVFRGDHDRLSHRAPEAGDKD
jgi:hypothetical protein